MRIGSLFSGAAGLDRAVEAVFGGRTVWHSEIDPAASKVLAYRYPDTPNLGDITKVDWTQVEPVDILCGGWPCQPWSAAGKQKGTADERALWPHVAAAVGVLRPRYVCLENVPGIVVLGELARAVGDLCAVGYDAQWATVSAASVGAPHRRERVFIVATDTGRGGRDSWVAGTSIQGGQAGRLTDSGIPTSATERSSDAAVSGDGPRVELLPTPTTSDGTGGGRRTPRERGSTEIFDSLRDTVCIATPQQWGKYEPAIRRWEQVVGAAPAPTEPNKNGNPRLNPEFSSWLMGWPAGWVTDVPGISRNDQLRIVGNGVCPQQCEAALRWLLSISEAAA